MEYLLDPCVRAMYAAEAERVAPEASRQVTSIE
jgi:hypothetical protein